MVHLTGDWTVNTADRIINGVIAFSNANPRPTLSILCSLKVSVLVSIHAMYTLESNLPRYRALTPRCIIMLQCPPVRFPCIRWFCDSHGKPYCTECMTNALLHSSLHRASRVPAAHNLGRLHRLHLVLPCCSGLEFLNGPRLVQAVPWDSDPILAFQHNLNVTNVECHV